MQTIILINPRGVADKNSLQPDELARIPLGLIALATYLSASKTRYNIKVIDTRIYPDEVYLDKLSSVIREHDINNIGMTVMTAQIPHALKLSKFVKELNHNIPIVWGGVHCTLFPEQTSQHPLVDYVVIGQGELPYSHLVQGFSAGVNNFDDVLELAINGRVNRKVRRVSPEKTRFTPELFDISEVPFMNFDVLDDIDRYIGPAPHFLLSPDKPVRLIEMVTSRGCPWSCTFCSNPLMPGQKAWRKLNPERALNEIEHQVKKHKLDGVRFLDEDFFPNKHRVRGIAEGLIERKLNIIWGANARANYFRDNYINDEFANLLYKSGMRAVSTGVESGSPKILKKLKKDITVDDVIKEAEVCNKAGLNLVLSWMIGIPGESKDDIEKTLELQRKVSNIHNKARHSATWIFRPYPGGELYDECLKSGLHEPKSLEEWNNIQESDDPLIGWYNADRLPWINDVRYVEFVSRFHNVLSHTLKQSLKKGMVNFIQTILIKSSLYCYHVPILGLLFYNLFYNIFKSLKFLRNSISKLFIHRKQTVKTAWCGAKTE